MREKSAKRNEQSLQEMWDYVKRPNLCLIGVPECDEENESKLEIHSNAGNTENTTKIFHKKSNPKAHNRQIHQG